MQIELGEEELATLRAALERHIEEQMRELACTEHRGRQHEMARTVEGLEAIARKLAAFSTAAPTASLR